MGVWVCGCELSKFVVSVLLLFLTSPGKGRSEEVKGEWVSE